MNPYLGFAIKSGSVVFGVDSILVCKRKMFLIVADCSLSANAFCKLEAYSEQRAIPLVRVEGLERLACRKGVKAIAITNASLAQQIANHT